MAGAPHAIRFPGETDDYRRARNALLVAECELRERRGAAAARRRTLPLGGPVEDGYLFGGAPGPAFPVMLRRGKVATPER